MNPEERELSRLGLALVIISLLLAAIVVYVTWVGRFE
jgi:hypothetical protein